MCGQKPPRIPLPESWSKHVRAAMLHVICLAQYATVYTRSWAVDSLNGRVRLRAKPSRVRSAVFGIIRLFNYQRKVLRGSLSV